MPRIDDDYGVRTALWAVALAGAAFALTSPFVLAPSGVVGVALGAGMATLNLWALGRIVGAFVNGAGLPWVLLGAFKLVGLLLIVAFLLKLGVTTIIPLAIGYAALPVGIVFSQLCAARPRVATSASIEPAVEADYSSKGR